MSKYSNHSESIASYLEGHMSPGQMQEFEKQLHTDPVLRSEFELQKDIIHSIKDFRKAQLKTKLDQVPVNVGPSTLVGVKAAAALVISGVIGVGAYLYLSTPDEITAPITETIAPVENLQVQPEDLAELPDELPTSEVEVVEEAVVAQPKTVIEQPASVPVSEPDKVVEEEPEEANLVVNSPNLIDPILNDAEAEESIEIPTAALAQDGMADNSVVAVETAKKDDNMFHYQYYSGKLYLYGDFRDIPYEILELNSANGKRLFIFYDNAYYKIKDDQQEITPLEALTDQDIIKKLEIIQANK
jgi:hypothetical protein